MPTSPDSADAPVSSSTGGQAHRQASPARGAAKLALGYFVVAALWIFLTDLGLNFLTTDAAQRAQFATYKGLLFVIVTAAVLFWLVRAHLAVQREGEEKLRSFVEHSPVALAMLDRELRYVMTSRRWKTDFNLGDRELKGVRHYDLFPYLPADWLAVHARALQGETIRAELDSLQCPDGSVIWLRWEVRPWRDAAGAIGGIVIFAEDVSARKRSEDALADSQARLRLALSAGHVSTWTWDVGTDRLDCDEGILQLIGRSHEEVLRGGLAMYMTWVHPDDREALDAAVARMMEQGSEASFEYRMVRPDGSIVWIVDRGQIERDAAGAVVRMTGACVDVTESHRMQQALHESENRFREVVETILEVFWISDPAKNRILYVSPAYERIWGRSCSDLYCSSRAWIDAVHSDDRERVRHAAMTKQKEGTYDETYRVMRPDGTIRWIRDLAYPVRDVSGAVVRIIGTARDITESKHLEEQFLRTQRLEAIGTLASGVAHDLNNILAPLFMVVPLLKERLSGQDDLDMLGILESSAQRGANVVRQLLTFSRGIAGERGPLQVRHLVKEMTAIMTETFPREIGIVHQVPSDLWPVVGDGTQLHQVLMNLCVNARDAMPDGGKLSIDARNAELTKEDVAGQNGVEPGRFVVITVSDTGHGIPEEIKAKIFEPFFTTKAVGKGTGLGLSTVIGIVKSHGGFVTLESRVGRGTQFHIHIPSAEGRADFAPPVRPSAAAPGRGEIVLIVDDETNVRQGMQRVLEHNGYGVLTAANGREGLGVYLLQRDKIAIVVTDLMMPEMDGVALVRALRDLSPGLPILASTGLISGEKQEALASLHVNELLPKPYTSFELVEAVGRALASRKNDQAAVEPKE